MGHSEILPRINIAPFQLPVPLGKCLLYTEMKFKCHGARTRLPGPRSRQHDGGILRLAGLPRLRGDAAHVRPHRGLLRVFCAEETKHHVWVPDGRQENGHVSHIHVTDSQVLIISLRFTYWSLYNTNTVRSFSYISGISLLGLPAEMYTYGTQLWTVVLSEWAVSLTIAIIYLPVFYNLEITSTYEVNNLLLLKQLYITVF